MFCSLRAFVILIRRTVFERLNTGGQQLNQQELRNSLYSGPFNELLIELAGNGLFDRLWGIPPYDEHYRKDEGYISPELAENKLFRRMRDCEIVLRFFAFRGENRIKGSVRNILDNFMKDNRDAQPGLIQGFRSTFLDCLKITYAVFGKRAFQIPNEKGKWQQSVPLFDAVMVSIEGLLGHAAKLISKRADVRAALQETFKDIHIYEILVGKPNTATAIKDRINIVQQLLGKYS